jgi:uncharacterized protein YukE
VGGKGFRVEPDKLLAVADDVHRLLEDLNGDSGYVPGNLPRYQQKASDAVLTQALQSFWSGEDIFATAYGYEHNGIVSTMNAMVQQLTNLETACRTTAQQYKSQDTNSKHDVKATDPNAAW